MRKLHAMLLCLALICCLGAASQNVERQGNTFTQVSKKSASKDEGTPTKYQYVDSKGKVYTVMLSSTGKAFIWKTSQKSGKAYKQYLPEIGKQINPSAYEEKAKLLK